jgi:hypothetical protein
MLKFNRLNDERLGEGGTQTFIVHNDNGNSQKKQGPFWANSISNLKGAPGGSRTHNLGVRSALLCPLSYWGWRDRHYSILK